MHLLDANVFIEAKNDYYGFDVAPGFWEWLLDMHSAGAVASIHAVRQELLDQDDELTDWVRTAPASFWVPEDAATAAALTRIATWTMDPQLQYRPAARSEFLGAADFRLVAAGLAGSHTIVTREQPAPNARRRILLPDACTAHGVSFTSPFDLYRMRGLRLVQP